MTNRRRVAALIEAIIATVGAHIALGEGSTIGSCILIAFAIVKVVDVMVEVVRDA